VRPMRTAGELVGPALVLVLVGVVGRFVSTATQGEFVTALVMATTVIGLYVFVGNSGVLSFGHVSFVALGALCGGLLTVPKELRTSAIPQLFPFLQHFELGNAESLALAAGLGAVYALLVGIPLMRLSGLAAGIATFAILGITTNVLYYWTKVSPGPKALSLVPETTGLLQATVVAVIAALVAFAYQRSRPGRLLRASREDPAAAQASGVNIHRQRLWAFVLSGAVSGLAGALFVHQLGSFTVRDYDLTNFPPLPFLTLAMLVIGGVSSLWGAVIGAIGVSFLDSVLGNAENGIHLGFATLTLPEGSRLIVEAVLMAFVLIVRPAGLTGGRELGFRSSRYRRRVQATQSGAL
jgi:branched-chain amino acid transport system permease protein